MLNIIVTYGIKSIFININVVNPLMIRGFFIVENKCKYLYNMDRIEKVFRKYLTSIILSIIFCLQVIGLDFESSNYYMNNYLFDAQLYAKNTFVTENYLSYDINNFTPYIGFSQYQSLDKYQESDFSIGSEYKITDKVKLDLGSWYYYYYSSSVNYFEPYISVSYDWIIIPKFYISMLSYNWKYRSVVSLEKEFSLNKFIYTPKIVIGTVNYDDYRYEYVGLINRLDYKVTDNFKLFVAYEFDKPFETINDSVVQSITSGIGLEF